MVDLLIRMDSCRAGLGVSSAGERALRSSSRSQPSSVHSTFWIAVSRPSTDLWSGSSGRAQRWATYHSPAGVSTRHPCPAFCRSAYGLYSCGRRKSDRSGRSMGGIACQERVDRSGLVRTGDVAGARQRHAVPVSGAALGRHQVIEPVPPVQVRRLEASAVGASAVDAGGWAAQFLRVRRRTPRERWRQGVRSHREGPTPE